MNEVLAQLHARKSVRAFADTPVPPEVKRAVLEAACAAPTAGNQQLYTILDITDQALKDTLADTCDHQPSSPRAPMVLIFCADCQKWYDAFRRRGCAPRKPEAGDLWLALSDANIAAQNAVTAAWSLGLGSCYIGDILEHAETHRELLNLRSTWCPPPWRCSATPRPSSWSGPSPPAVPWSTSSTKMLTGAWMPANWRPCWLATPGRGPTPTGWTPSAGASTTRTSPGR